LPRPHIDARAVRDRIVAIAEELLVESCGQRLVLSDIAARMGVSQPYIYRHFKNKQALIAELAERWFHKIEKVGHDICLTDKRWQDQLKEHILQTLKLKRAAYDHNPKLFAAYLSMAQLHPTLIEKHINTLIAQITQILSRHVPKQDIELFVNFILDATVQFRTPAAIINAPTHATEERATIVIDAVITYIESQTR